jgi:chromosome partitioning protein
VRTIAFISGTGGEGKTSLVYHLAHMLPRLGYPTLAVDVDPQAALSVWLLGEEQMEGLWMREEGTIASCIAPVMEGRGKVESRAPIEVAEALWCIAGSPALWGFEHGLMEAWLGQWSDSTFALRALSVFHDVVQQAGRHVGAEVALLDLGSSLGAINRTALLAADFLVLPLEAGTLSLQGLKILGPTVRHWRTQWSQRREQSGAEVRAELPEGRMYPVGYAVLRTPSWAGRTSRVQARWLEQIPFFYRTAVLGEEATGSTLEEDPQCLAVLPNYHSLLMMAWEARRPMFDLRPADGAMGSHGQLVQRCYEDFESLATTLAERCGLEKRD